MKELHRELSIRSISWLNSRTTASGNRWGTEVMICPKTGWIADAVVFAFPQHRFLQKIKPQPEVWPDTLLYIFESKISRTDFNKSFSGKYTTHKLELKGNLHYIVTPKNMIKQDELPEGWGWLILSGNGLKEIVVPKYNPISEDFKLKVGWRMLWNNYSRRASIEDWELKRGCLF